MKPYEKPKLIALSLGGNERLCGECADNAAKANFPNPILLYKDPSGSIASSIDFVLNGAGADFTITKSELNGVFGSGENCGTEIAMYCKFTGTEMMIAWS